MKAAVGDRIIVASTRLGRKVREGRVVEVQHGDGSPPYLVEWDDGGQRALVFPGPDAHILASGHDELPEPGAGAFEGAVEGTRTPPAHIRSWQVRLDIFEDGGRTTAHAVLLTGSPTHVDARGTARRRDSDADVPEIGDEIAVARALRELSDVLLGTAAGDIAAVEGHPVVLPR